MGNENIELLIGNIVRQALEDLFQKPLTVIPESVKDINREKWLDGKNKKIEANRLDALLWLCEDGFKDYNLNTDYIVDKFYRENKGHCIGLFTLLSKVYKTTKTVCEAPYKKEIDLLLADIDKAETKLKEASRREYDLKQQVKSLENKNKRLVEKVNKITGKSYEVDYERV